MKTERFKGALLSVLIIASIMALAIPLLSPSLVHAALTPHAPILIVGNAHFTKPDPVNGGGSGTADDPYILENWDIDASSANGIYIENTTAYFVIRNCYVHDGRAQEFYGIKLDNVINGRLEKNASENNYYGICIFYCSSNNTLINNICKNNSNGGIYLEVSPYHNLINNTCENNPDGICLSYSSYDNLINNTCLKNYCGIYLYHSPYNNLINNRCSNNSTYGIWLSSSSNNTLENNTCSYNPNYGIYLYYSSYNDMINNTCSNNSTCGIYLYYYSSNNTLINNTIKNNSNGIDISYSSNNNHIYHNNFANILTQASDSCSNFWDDGYPSGGNYWSDYTGADNYRGDNQNIPGSDGIGDTPYYIPGGSNRDWYPLMNPFPFPWTGWSVFGLENLYVVRLEKNLYLAQGSKLVVKFYSYDNTYENEVVIENFTPPWYVVENENVSHPGGKGVMKAKLWLVDNADNEISKIKGWVTIRDDLWARLLEIRGRWPYASSDERNALWKELLGIRGQWPYAPTTRDPVWVDP